VKTTFGYHVIRLASVKEEGTLPLAAVKERIRQMVTMEKVEALAGQKAEALAGHLGKGKKLEDAAKEEGLTVQKTQAFARGVPPPPHVADPRHARLRDEGGRRGEGETSRCRGARRSSPRGDPARPPPGLKDVQDKSGPTSSRNGRREAKAAAEEVKTRAAAQSLDKAAMASASARRHKRSPARPALGDLGTSAALRRSPSRSPRRRLSDAWCAARGLRGHPHPGEEGVRPRGVREAEGLDRSSLRQQKKNRLFQPT
jgi:hypothetical protein